jgi:hypothetical protein
VRNLATEILNKEWRFTGESIVIDDQGRLIDGQHRCEACVSSNRPIISVVVRGVDPHIIRTLDSGATRSPADVLRIHGHKYASALASALRFWCLWVRGRLFSAGYKPSNAEYVELAKKYKKARECAEWSSKTPKHVTSHVGAGLRFVLLEHSDAKMEDVVWFFDRVCDGLDLPQSHPAHVLRERLLKHAYGEEKLTRYNVIRAWIYAWNAFYEGRTLKSLVIRANPAVAGAKVPRIQKKVLEASEQK